MISEVVLEFKADMRGRAFAADIISNICISEIEKRAEDRDKYKCGEKEAFLYIAQACALIKEMAESQKCLWEVEKNDIEQKGV